MPTRYFLTWVGNTSGYRMDLDQGGLNKLLQYKHFAYSGTHIIILLPFVVD